MDGGSLTSHKSFGFSGSNSRSGCGTKFVPAANDATVVGAEGGSGIGLRTGDNWRCGVGGVRLRGDTGTAAYREVGPGDGGRGTR